MATVVDELVVKLGLNSEPFKRASAEARQEFKKTSEAAGRTAKEMEASGKRGAEFFAQIKNEALGLIGVLLGATGAGDIIKKTTENLANLGREAANLNVDPQKLAAFSMVFERFGASAASTKDTLFGISQAIERFKIFGDAGVLRFLNPIGADANNSPFEILQKFVEFAQAHKNDAALVNQIGKGLGIDQGTINAALQMKSFAQFQREYNDALKDAPTAAQVEQAQKLQKAWVELKQAAQGLANTIVTDLSPALESVFEWGKEEIRQNPQLIEAITAIVTGLGALKGIRITASILGLDGVASVISAIETGLAAVISKMTTLGALLSLHGDTTQDDPAMQEAPGSEFFGQNGPVVHWWRRHMPTWLGGSPLSSSPPTSGQAHANMVAARAYFLSQGYSSEQVAGILANIQAESGFNPGAVGDNGQAFGLFQWHPDRQRMFRLWAGHPIQDSTLQEQLEFAQWELTHTEKAAGDRLRRQTEAYGSGAAVSAGYERPADAAAAADYRGRLAQQMLGAPLSPAGSKPNTTINITGPITVTTQATDAKGIARNLTSAITTQANRGLQ